MGLTLDSSKGRALGNYRIYDLTNKENIVHDEIVFRASFIILSDCVCSGMILGNFDLVVLGNMEAESIEIKGKLICFGSIKAKKVVAKDIVGSSIIATDVDATDGIMAQEIEADTIKSDGTIIVGKNITVEEIIETRGDILCGEGLYAYGKVKAKTILATDNIDIDEMEVQKEPLTKTFEVKGKTEGFDGDYKEWKAKKIRESEQFVLARNLRALDEYLEKNKEVDFLSKYSFAVSVVKSLNAVAPGAAADLALFLRLHRAICETPTIKQFDIVVEKHRVYNEAFINAAKANIFDDVKCEFRAYSDFIDAITIIQKHGEKLDKQLFLHVIDRVYNSGLGVKATYLNAIFQRRGWKIND